MPSTPSGDSFHRLSGRWVVLAEKRREHLVELYKNGRWKLYYTEREFLDALREAVGAVERWRGIAQSSPPAAALDRAA